MPKKKPKTMAYLRVSTIDQDLQKFKRDIKCQRSRVIE